MKALVFALMAALGNLAGAWAVIRHARRGLHVIDVFLALGAGFMLAVALVDMVPEAITRDSLAPAFMLAGYLAVHLAQHVAVPHFHFGEETHRLSASAGVSALIGLLLHTFFDGVAIASGFLVSPGLGLLLFIAVFLHKLPEGVAMASVILSTGQSAARAVAAAGALGAATVLGVLLTDVAAPLRTHGLAIAAGVTLYVAASNLVPEIQARKGRGMWVAFFAGAAFFFLLRTLLPR